MSWVLFATQYIVVGLQVAVENASLWIEMQCNNYSQLFFKGRPSMHRSFAATRNPLSCPSNALEGEKLHPGDRQLATGAQEVQVLAAEINC